MKCSAYPRHKKQTYFNFVELSGYLNTGSNASQSSILCIKELFFFKSQNLQNKIYLVYQSLYVYFVMLTFKLHAYLQFIIGIVN